MTPEVKEILDRLVKENELLFDEILRLREQVHDLTNALKKYAACQHKGCDFRCIKEKVK